MPPKLPIIFFPKSPKEAAAFQKWANKTYGAFWLGDIRNNFESYLHAKAFIVESSSRLVYSDVTPKYSMIEKYTIIKSYYFTRNPILNCIKDTYENS